jgi:hypothetical protein
MNEHQRFQNQYRARGNSCSGGNFLNVRRPVWAWSVAGTGIVAFLFVIQAWLAYWDWRLAWTWLQTSGLEALAIALSPLIALQVSAGIERSRDSENRKMEVLQTLMETRHAVVSDDRIRALNRVTILFSTDAKVLEAHRTLMASLSKPINQDGTVPPLLLDEWNERQWELVSAISEILHVSITKDEFALGYAPRSLMATVEQQRLAIETNKSLMSLARMQLGLRWDPKFLAQLQPGVGVVGPYQEPPDEPSSGQSTP